MCCLRLGLRYMHDRAIPGPPVSGAGGSGARQEGEHARVVRTMGRPPSVRAVRLGEGLAAGSDSALLKVAGREELRTTIRELATRH